MNLILTMCGKYSRFTNEGYKIPKFLLPWGNHSILSEILYQMKGFDNIYLVANEADNAFISHVRKILSFYSIPQDHLIMLKDTSGQAETAFIGMCRIKNLTGPVVFHNIDTILYGRNFKDLSDNLSNNAGYIDVFNSNNHEYSYVLVDENNYIKEIKEKILISDLATSGMYGFSSSKMFLDYYSKSSLYISEIYRNMMQNGEKIITGKHHTEKDTLVVGTPSEYLNLSKYIK